ncbi:MAG: AraC family transcriptional regulator [Kiritimatiellae bacterium]|nr:AraC family transcriptional regulator [Kiritimatiellia bacterium]
MPIMNSKPQYSDSPDCKVLDLTKIGIPDIPVLSFIRYTYRKPPIAPHNHKGCFEIGLCLRGYFVHETNNVQQTIVAGDIFLNNPEDAHRMLDYPKGTILYVIMLRTENPKKRFLRFTKAESNEIRNKLLQLPVHLTTNSSSIKHAFIELFRSYENLQGRYRTISMTVTCMKLITSLLETFLPKPLPSHPDRINTIIEAMHKTPEKHYNVDSLAYQAALSPSHFINQFKRITGLPPHQFLIKCRLDQAKVRLKNTSLSITRIAQDLGFCSSQHFASHFRRATGVTPSAWRQENS